MGYNGRTVVLEFTHGLADPIGCTHLVEHRYSPQRTPLGLATTGRLFSLPLNEFAGRASYQLSSDTGLVEFDSGAGGMGRTKTNQPVRLRRNIVTQRGRKPDAHPTRETLRVTRDRLVRLAYRFLWNRDDAEDVAQDALLKAEQRDSPLRDADKWWSWLARVVVNGCYEKRRRSEVQHRHEPLVRLELGQRVEAGVRDDGTTGSTDSNWLVPLISELPRRQQEVVVLRHLEGMGYDEIAEMLGITRSTARVHARAGLEALRELILQRCPEKVGASTSTP